MKNRLILSGLLVVAIGALALVVFAAPYQRVTFFNGSLADGVEGVNVPASGVSRVSTVTNFQGYLAANTTFTSQDLVQSNMWTTTNLVSSASVTFVLGGYANVNGTNTLLVSGAGSNAMNGIYSYVSGVGWSSYTNSGADESCGIYLMGTYWLATNAAGVTNYRKLAATGIETVGANTWLTVLPGVAPVPTVSYYNASGDALPLGMNVMGSYDKTNWFGMTKVYATPPTVDGWFVGYADLTLTNVGYLTVNAGTNYATNLYVTNAYMHGYFK